MGPRGFIKLGSWNAADKLIAARVQQELDDKSSKNYSEVDAVWLCIYQNAPITDSLETVALARALKLPARHLFERIYLCWYAHAGEGGGFRARVVLDRHARAEGDPIRGVRRGLDDRGDPERRLDRRDPAFKK